jgi:hypothetical protein
MTCGEKAQSARLDGNGPVKGVRLGAEPQRVEAVVSREGSVQVRWWVCPRAPVRAGRSARNYGLQNDFVFFSDAVLRQYVSVTRGAQCCRENIAGAAH